MSLKANSGFIRSLFMGVVVCLKFWKMMQIIIGPCSLHLLFLGKARTSCTILTRHLKHRGQRLSTFAVQTAVCEVYRKNPLYSLDLHYGEDICCFSLDC